MATLGRIPNQYTIKITIVMVLAKTSLYVHYPSSSMTTRLMQICVQIYVHVTYFLIITGELIGVDYLAEQSSELALPCQESSRFEEQLEAAEEDDEGFEDEPSRDDPVDDELLETVAPLEASVAAEEEDESGAEQDAEREQQEQPTQVRNTHSDCTKGLDRGARSGGECLSVYSYIYQGWGAGAGAVLKLVLCTVLHPWRLRSNKPLKSVEGPNRAAYASISR